MAWFDSIFRPASKARFAQLIARQLKLAGDERDSVFVPECFQLRFVQDGDEAGVANLANIYAEYMARGASDRPTFIRQSVRSLLSAYKTMPTEMGDVEPDLFPIVRERSYFQYVVPGDKNVPGECPHVPLGDHLAVGLAYDLPEAMIMVQQDHLDQWGVSFYEAYEVALANLGQIDAAFASFDDRFFIADCRDNYDASRILLTDVIEKLNVSGDHVVMVPNRDTLLITGSEEEVGLRMMIKVANTTLAKPRAMSGLAFRLVDGDWNHWLPPEIHPCHLPLKKMYLSSLVGAHQHQQMMLNEPTHASPSFAASLSMIRLRKSDDVATYSVLVEGRTTLLPRSDFVFFKLQETTPGYGAKIYARWDDFQSVMGNAVEELDTYPVRYLVRRFPSADQLERMRCDDDVIHTGALIE